MSWKSTSSYDYLLFIPQKIGGDNKITIQNDYPCIDYLTIIMFVISGVLSLIAIIGVLIYVCRQRKKR